MICKCNYRLTQLTYSVIDPVKNGLVSRNKNKMVKYLKKIKVKKVLLFTPLEKITHRTQL